MVDRNLAIPAAILAAGAMIGLGLFLGLRGRDAQAPPWPEAVAAQAAVAEQTGALLADQRAALGARCWPSNGTEQALQPQHYIFNYTFGADGTQLARGVVVANRPIQGTETAAAITRCVLDTLAPLQILPPGAVSYVEIPFEIP